MPTIADFNVIDAGSHTFSIPEPNVFSPPEVIEYVFSAPAVDAGSRSILLFRLHPEGETDCRVEMNLNNTLVFARTLTPGIERSMHVAIPPPLGGMPATTTCWCQKSTAARFSRSQS